MQTHTVPLRRAVAATGARAAQYSVSASLLSAPTPSASSNAHCRQTKRHFAGVSDITHPTSMPSPKLMRQFQPKELVQNQRFKAIPPEKLEPTFQSMLGKQSVLADPGKILKLYASYVKRVEEPEAKVLVQAFCGVGMNFHPNTFLTTQDRQTVTNFRGFKELCHDLNEKKNQISAKEAPKLLFAMACLEYRFWQLAPTLLDLIVENVDRYNFSALSNVFYSLAVLNIGNAFENGAVEACCFGGEDSLSEDYSHVAQLVLDTILEKHCGVEASAVEDSENVKKSELIPSPNVAQELAQVMFSCVLLNVWDPRMPELMKGVCENLTSKEQLDDSGWLGYFIYQTLYCADVQKPEVELALKKSVPYVDPGAVARDVARRHASKSAAAGCRWVAA